ncbi:hypothetical protein G4V39_01725 [Thermosulfuriphilus ammonigenes]|uniref:Uncharacterized protein n=1 Tax=Thermosulfuriphilus ammonigenes TaxID=1936021 RepID=A0A6G7PUF1_9BACT|nr:hypothetical protein [Thermosulfuriphilus ammonigenes]MBA2848805.1 methyl-accepting chemotaxis protein [Thermosulfuriphilus ammonigenes]QIJ71068.1 hypothetical protein G4V39_01725 [Thermosulfuriphilus ammonigenes]
MKLGGMSLANKVALFFLLVIGLSIISLVITVQKYHQKELLSRARATAAYFIGVPRFANSVKGLWAQDTSIVPTVATVTAYRNAQELTLHRLHDPDLAKALAKTIGASGIEIKLNGPLPQLPPSGESWSYEKGTFHYQKLLTVEKGCLSCHQNGGTRPYLHLGEAVGVISVSIYGQGIWQALSSAFSVWNAAFFLVAVLALYVLVRFELISPLTDLNKKVEMMSVGDLDVDLGVSGLEEKDVKDELLRLAIAIERLRKSQKTMERLLDEEGLLE